MTVATIRTNPQHWAGCSYSTLRQATKACISDWLTGCGSSICDTSEGAPMLASELFSTTEGRMWLALETTEDGEPIDTGELRCTQPEAVEIIREILAAQES